MNQPTTSLCPSDEQLAKLAAGDIPEHIAEEMFQHIDGCTECQTRMDHAAAKTDLALAPVKSVRRHDTPPTQDAHLSELIHYAQRRRDNDDTKSSRSSITRIVSEIAFVDTLRKSGLLPQNEIDQMLSDLSWERSKSGGDSSSLAKRFISSRKLTKFQAKLLLRGRYKGLVLGNYTILDKLGQGGMGSVFKARHTRMGRLVCLKVVNSTGRQSAVTIDRFRNEARALASLTHPNIVVAHDANEMNGVPYLVMEFIDGLDLSKRIKQEGPIAAEETLEIAIQVASALEYAHSKGVIHRDVKPHNIVAHHESGSDATRVKVLDLGLARFDTMMSDNPDASVLAAMTNTGVVIGTVDYMAPEQALDGRNADARSDIYSLGCTLYFLLIGRPPFAGETVVQRLIAHREERPRSLCSFMKSDITHELNSVVQKMLRKDPLDRYQSMSDVRRDLEALRAGNSVAVEPLAKPFPRPAPPPIHTPPPPPEGYLDDSVEIENIDKDSAGLIIAPVYLRTLAAAAVLAIAIVGPIVAFWPREPEFNPTIPEVKVGAQLAARNGGDGRAVVIVSSKKFDTEQFTAVTQAMVKRRVDITVAAVNYSPGKRGYMPELREPFTQMRVRDIQPSEFDAIIVIGGDNGELSKSSKANHRQIQRIVQQSLESGTALASCSRGTLSDGTVYNKPEYKDAQKHEFKNTQDFVNFLDDHFDDLFPKPNLAEST